MTDVEEVAVWSEYGAEWKYDTVDYYEIHGLRISNRGVQTDPTVQYSI